MEFMREYPDDASCLGYLWRTRYAEDGEHAECPKCEQVRSFKRYETAQRRQSWTCTACGHHIHPTAGTIFHKSSTSLHLWFYAIYLVSSSKCGIAAKQLEREIGVNYKTALRMLHLIRQDLMEQDYTGQLSGEVEADSAYVGGQLHEDERSRLRAQGRSNQGPATKDRPVIFAAVERKGRLRAAVVGTSRTQAETTVTLQETMRDFVLPASMVFTDDWGGYNAVERTGRYQMRRVRHSQRIYVDGQRPHEHGRGLLRALQDRRARDASLHFDALASRYLNEWVWKWNHRDRDYEMFRTLLDSAASRA